MQTEWIGAGVILLVAVLAGKMVLEQRVLQRLGLTFTFLWAALAAVHFWERGMGVFGGLAGLVPGIPGELVTFWLLFVLCATPGMLFLRLWLGSFDAIFPYLMERLSAAVCTLVFAVGMTSLVVMSAFLLPRFSGFVPKAGVGGRVSAALGRAPLRAYVMVARPFEGGMSAGEAAAEQGIPAEVQRRFDMP